MLQSDTEEGDATADNVVVLGVDTHKDVHVAAVISMLGVFLASQSFPTTAAGYEQMLAWARTFGTVRQAGVECTGSYGAALTRYLRAHHVSVIEINQPDKATRRKRGKTDAVDAESAARAVLSGRATAIAKTSDGPVEMMRMFKLAKTSALKARTQAINQLKAVLVTTDPALRESLAGLSRWMLIRRCAELDTTDPRDAVAAAIYTLRLLGQRILRLGEEIRELEQHITTAINACAPALLHRRGIGHDSAAALLLAAGDNPERLDTEASFAALCGTSPIEASSGKTQRRRLNRGGDRQANAALYRIVLTRLRCDPSTQEYLQRRLAQGKTRREVIRCLKRYVAREVHPLLRQVWTTPESTPSPLDKT
ncbi:IS110 family RNA-guided transposase [Actinokineospora iranica]